MAKMTEIKQKITIPDSVEIAIENNNLTAKGEKGSISRVFFHPKIDLKVNGKVVEIHCKNPRRKDRASAGTFAAHIKNMIKGVTVGFEYKMKTVFSHFPIKTFVEGNELVIQNFLGERSSRRVKIVEGVTVEAKGDDVTVRGIDKEKVGQTATNIERATKIKHRDIRVFQDGIYLVSKGGK